MYCIFPLKSNGIYSDMEVNKLENMMRTLLIQQFLMRKRRTTFLKLTQSKCLNISTGMQNNGIWIKIINLSQTAVPYNGWGWAASQTKVIVHGEKSNIPMKLNIVHDFIYCSWSLPNCLRLVCCEFHLLHRLLKHKTTWK